MKKAIFNYHLPEELVAKFPSQSRSGSRLMVINPESKNSHRMVTDLPFLIRKGDVVVANNTKVFPARLFGVKPSGGRVEVMIERLESKHTAKAFVKSNKSLVQGTVLLMDGGFRLTITGRAGDLFLIQSHDGTGILDLAEKYGHIPLPPYMKRDDTPLDRERYQTVFAKNPGAAAAPTAGLHLDKSLIDSICAHGATWCEVTLHVGAGTFNPVRVDNIEDHQMHSEWYSIAPEVCQTIRDAKAEGRRIVAIGTTTMRCLEGSAAANGGQIHSGADETSIFITPGYSFKVVDALFTNFHLPESTLLMLVSAFGGYGRMMAAYEEAARKGYRFFSYGDACFITRDPEASHAS